MKNIKTIGFLGLIMLITIITISALTNKDKQAEIISTNYKDIRHYGLLEFTNMDLGVIGYFPTQRHWKQIDENIELVPVDSLRYIDSLDINKISDTLFVKVYNQNYAYQCKNIYSVAENSDKKTDTLKIYNIYFDLKMKDIIEDAEKFRTKDFTVNYIIKHDIDNVDKRIIINKNYR
jgi:hypothetical protein